MNRELALNASALGVLLGAAQVLPLGVDTLDDDHSDGAHGGQDLATLALVDTVEDLNDIVLLDVKAVEVLGASFGDASATALPRFASISSATTDRH
jgi:hypothetical protein